MIIIVLIKKITTMNNKISNNILKSLYNHIEVQIKKKAEIDYL